MQFEKGFDVQIAPTLGDARQAMLAAPDLLILDLMLPDGSGFELIDEIAASGRGGSIIVLSSREDENDRVRALEGGADDYVTKPFSPREVVARVGAVLRRSASLTPAAKSTLPFTIDPDARKIAFEGHGIDLTRVEFDLLRLLTSEPEKVFSRSAMIDSIWGPGFALSDRTVDSHIKALRRKLSEAGGQSDWIETIRGIGYRFTLNSSSE